MRSLSALVLLGAGCSGEAEPATMPPPTGCTASETELADGRCQPPGLPIDLPCPPGEWPDSAANCAPAGATPSDCVEGFVHDGDRACEPILPADPCAEAMLAIPGDTACRELAPCGAAPWGEIPIETNTQFVNIDYTGGDSTGASAKPWTSIQAAIDAAAPGAIVAVAAGRYQEDIVIDKPVRLWGRCPSLVEVAGTGAELAALFLVGGAQQSEVRAIAVSGAGAGLVLSGAVDVLFDSLWIHDSANRGLNIEGTLGPTTARLQHSLLERNRVNNVFVGAAMLDVEGVAIRDAPMGRGIDVESASSIPDPAKLDLRHSLIDGVGDTGIFVGAAEALIEGTVVRNLTATDTRGINIESHPTSGARSTTTVRGILVERAHGLGVYIRASDVSMEGVVVREIEPRSDGSGGRGIGIESGRVGVAEAAVNVQRSLIERAHEVGVYSGGSRVQLEGVAVRAIEADSVSGDGYGLAVQADPDTHVASKFVMRGSLVEQTREFAVFIEGSEATLESVAVRGTTGDSNGEFGRGLQIQLNPQTLEPARVSVWASVVESNHSAGVIAAGADLTLEASVVRRTAANSSELHGDGAVAIFYQIPSRLSLLGTIIEESERAGVSAFGSRVALEKSLVRCNIFDLDGEAVDGHAFEFENKGGNRCGCPDRSDGCKVVSAGISAPPTAN